VKAKLYKGPFNGKPYQTDGRTEIVIRGDKPMSHRQRYEWDMENYDSEFRYSPRRYPQVEARYRIAMRAIQTSDSRIVTVPLYHPDGSIFYEYVKGSKVER